MNLAEADTAFEQAREALIAAEIKFRQAVACKRYTRASRAYCRKLRNEYNAADETFNEAERNFILALCADLTQGEMLTMAENIIEGNS